MQTHLSNGPQPDFQAPVAVDDFSPDVLHVSHRTLIGADRRLTAISNSLLTSGAAGGNHDCAVRHALRVVDVARTVVEIAIADGTANYPSIILCLDRCRDSLRSVIRLASRCDHDELREIASRLWACRQVLRSELSDGTQRAGVAGLDRASSSVGGSDGEKAASGLRRQSSIKTTVRSA